VVLPAGDPGPAQIIEFLPPPSTPWDAVSVVGGGKERSPEEEDDLVLDWTDSRRSRILDANTQLWMASYGLQAQKSLWRGWEATIYGEQIPV
jgi:hypothetical protein